VKTLRLLAVRHGATEWSQARRFAGSQDIPLTAHGRLQAEAVAQALAGTSAAAVYTSPLERARTSAEVIAKPHRLEAIIEPDFREMAFGAWEGLTRDEMATRFPAEAVAWASTPHVLTPPQGEPLAAVDSRVRAALAALFERHRGDTVILVSHAIVMRLIVLAALGLGPERLWSVDASPAGITEIDYQEDWATVHRLNTLAHLDGLREDPA
jgi:broad specificity phosphatase PhoE